VSFLWAKGLNAKYIHKERFHVYGGKWLWRKAVNSLKDVRKSLMMPEKMRKWPRQQSKRLVCYGFRRTGKAMGQVYQCWWRICREINVFFQGSNITCFTFYTHLWPIYWLSLVEMLVSLSCVSGRGSRHQVAADYSVWVLSSYTQDVEYCAYHFTLNVHRHCSSLLLLLINV
jgi:hypothetical protein